MIIGICEFDFIIPGAVSLKDKRKIIKSFIDKSKNKFNIAIAEVDKNDLWHNSTIGVVTVSNNKKHVDIIVTKYLDFIDTFPELQLRNYDIDIL